MDMAKQKHIKMLLLVEFVTASDSSKDCLGQYCSTITRRSRSTGWNAGFWLWTSINRTMRVRSFKASNYSFEWFSRCIWVPRKLIEWHKASTGCHQQGYLRKWRNECGVWQRYIVVSHCIFYACSKCPLQVAALVLSRRIAACLSLLDETLLWNCWKANRLSEVAALLPKH